MSTPGHSFRGIEAALIGHQAAGDLVQRIFAGDNGVEAGQKLPQREKLLAAAIPVGLLDHLVESISGNELEKLKEAIVKHCWFFCAQIKDFRHL